MSYRKPAPSLELSYFSTTLLKKNEEGLNKELTTIKVCKSIHCHLSCLLEIWLGHEITLKESPTADLIVLLSFGPGFNQNTLEKVNLGFLLETKLTGCSLPSKSSTMALNPLAAVKSALLMCSHWITTGICLSSCLLPALLT